MIRGAQWLYMKGRVGRDHKASTELQLGMWAFTAHVMG